MPRPRRRRVSQSPMIFAYIPRRAHRSQAAPHTFQAFVPWDLWKTHGKTSIHFTTAHRSQTFRSRNANPVPFTTTAGYRAKAGCQRARKKPRTFSVSRFPNRPKTIIRGAPRLVAVFFRIWRLFKEVDKVDVLISERFP